MGRGALLSAWHRSFIHSMAETVPILRCSTKALHHPTPTPPRLPPHRLHTPSHNKTQKPNSTVQRSRSLFLSSLSSCSRSPSPVSGKGGVLGWPYTSSRDVSCLWLWSAHSSGPCCQGKRRPRPLLGRTCPRSANWSPCTSGPAGLRGDSPKSQHQPTPAYCPSRERGFTRSPLLSHMSFSSSGWSRHNATSRQSGRARQSCNMSRVSNQGAQSSTKAVEFIPGASFLVALSRASPCA